MQRYQTRVPSPAVSPVRSSFHLLRCFVAWLRLCRERRRQRLALAELGDDQLKDIGLTAADVRAECAKPYWR
jgi:uncharacterized protein YjiS (DUF1127 family)